MKTRVAPAVVILGQNSIAVARQIINILPGAKLYGLASRTCDVDVSFTSFGDTLRELFAAGTPIIGICAAGILIRTLAPLITDKSQEPPVLAVAEDGSAVVPLLGGLSGVNELARQIAEALNIQAAITTTGDLRFRTALLSPPPGYHLANPEDAKKFIADLLAGAKVKLVGTAPWLSESNLPIDDNGELTIQVTEKEVIPQPDCLVYHPAKIAIAITSPSTQTLTQIHELLADAQVSPKAVAVILAPLYLAANPILQNIAKIFQVPTRFFQASQLTEFTTQGYSFHEAVVFVGTEPNNKSLCSPFSQITLTVSPQIIHPETIGQPQGKLAIIGTGPGASKWMSPEVKEILNAATDLVGYKTYINLIGALADGKNIHESDNREEEARAKMALDLAAEGRYVAVVSSGDPGIYAMATAVFEVIDRYNQPEWHTIDIQVAPGISAMQATAAAIGAPLGHDFCVISLSDILKPWEIIAQRITTAAQGDFVIAFYNPVSKERTWQLAEAKNILLQYRKADTPVILGWNLGRPGQAVKVITLEQLEPIEADMRTLIIVGSSQTRKIETSEQDIRVYTPRRYNS
ncbi:precorrin-3B C(17)-methyltransferase [Anabaena sphaerica FACHB-251]|uniref:Precorrin-3B C(17)-methyltransferase n=1 Tax=Anabaena sphaerica FACHB-251 TaxID=2692883 RepID=A0A927A3Q3_9NOST|nr:precorrin-3B C(17)-methyltransferase [Anabaena sphaerica]MBD2296723.1 precorrin-3B C(17)-methyltransferase [Anabaena sphaerica FACHB-251]